LKETNYPRSGSNTVTVIGSSFGASAYSQTIAAASSAASTVWISMSSICGKSTIGTGIRVPLTVSLMRRLSFMSSAMSYNLLVPQMADQMLPSTGCMAVMASGAGFGYMSLSHGVRMGQSAAQFSVWSSDSSVISLNSRGFSSTLSLVVSAFGTGSVSHIFSYKAPNLSSGAYNAPASGSVSVSLFGTSFSFQNSAGLKSGSSSVPASTWISDSSLNIKTMSGTSLRLGMKASVSNQVGSMNDELSLFGRPAPSKLHSKPVASGSSLVSLVGTNLGVVGMTAAMHLKATTVEATVWVSNSALLAKSSAGLGKDSHVVVSVHMQSGTETLLVTYVFPSVQVAISHTVPASGSSLLSVIGSSIGSVDSSQVLSRIGSSIPEVSHWIASSCMTSKVVAGHGTALSVELTVAQLSSKTTSVVSYSSVSISLIETVLNPCSGSISMTLFGGNFGLFSVSALTSRLGSSSSLQSSWNSDSALASKVAANAILIKAVFVSLSVKMSSITTIVSFSAAQLSSVQVHAMKAATGTFSISVVGAMYGCYHTSPRVGAGSSSCEVSAWISDSSAKCKASHGVAVALHVTLSLSKVSVGTLSKALSYSRCFISSTKSALLPSSGSSAVSIIGYSIGVVGLSPKARVHFSGGQSNRWISDSCMITKSSRNVANVYTVQASSSSQNSGLLTQSLTHDTPLLSSVSVTNIPVTGSTTLTVVGFNYGSYEHSLSLAKLRTGVSASSAILWIADSCILGKTVSSVASKASLSVLVSVRSLWSLRSSVLSYDRPRVGPLFTFDSSVGFAVSGAALITLSGGSGYSLQNPSAKVALDGTVCQFSQWLSDSAIRCRISHGGFARVTFLVSADSQTSLSSISEAIFSLLSMSSLRQRTLPTSGSVSVTLYGSNAGQLSRSQSVRMGFSAPSSHSWISDTSIVSKACHGLFASMPVLMSSGLKVTSLTRSFSYLSPEKLVLGTSNVASTGSSSVVVVAVGLGILGVSASSKISASACENSEWLAESSIVCKVPRGTAISSSVVVSSAVFAASSSFALSFNVVLHTSTFGTTNFPTSGAQFVSLSGANFGLHRISARSSLGFSAQELSSWISTSSIVPKVRRGSNFGLSTVVSAQLRTSSLTNSFTFDIGAASQIKSTNTPASGASMVSTAGLSFNSGSSLSHRVRISETAASRTLWLSDSSLLFKTVRGSMSAVAIHISSQRRASIITQISTYNAPLVSSARTASAVPSSGSIGVSVFGIFFGITASCQPKLHGSASERSNWFSDSSLTFKVASGFGVIRQVVVSASIGVGLGLFNVSFAVPGSVSSTSVTNVPSSGGASVTILGSGFSSVGLSNSVRVGFSSISLSLWSSNSAVLGKVSSGYGLISNTFVSVAQLTRSMSFGFSWNSPLILSAVHLDVVSSGSAIATIIGRNFAASGPSISVKIGRTVCSMSSWKSESSVFCKVVANTMLPSVSLPSP